MVCRWRSRALAGLWFRRIRPCSVGRSHLAITIRVLACSHSLACWTHSLHKLAHQSQPSAAVDYSIWYLGTWLQHLDGKSEASCRCLNYRAGTLASPSAARVPHPDWLRPLDHRRSRWSRRSQLFCRYHQWVVDIHLDWCGTGQGCRYDTLLLQGPLHDLLSTSRFLSDSSCRTSRIPTSSC